jgi:DNA segregation ATPase FtsK/SpoIIIE, S-DNA-T family
MPRSTHRTTRPPARRPTSGGSRARKKPARAGRPRPPVPALTATQIQEGAGVLLAGLGVIAGLAMLFEDAPILRGLNQAILGAFGVGWPLMVAAVIALGVILVVPSVPLPTPRILVAAAASLLSIFGLLSLASHDAGGALGVAIGTLLADLISRPGAVVVLVVVFLVGVIVAFRFSPGAVILQGARGARAAYQERRRLNALVGRARGDDDQARRSLRSLPAAVMEPVLAGTLIAPAEVGGAPAPEEEPVPPAPAASAVSATPPPAGAPMPLSPSPSPLPSPEALPLSEEPSAAEELAMRRAAAVQTQEPPLRVVAEPADDDEWDGITWKLPPISLLDSVRAKRERLEDEIKRNVRTIEVTLETFGVHARVIDVHPGPAVTQYALQPAPGVAVKRIVALQNDLALALAASPLRIEAPIPGKSAVGIEVPNKAAQVVTLRQVVESPNFPGDRQLPVVLGHDVAGQAIVGDLTRMPHLLIAGATGQGKSVCINTLVSSLLLRTTPEQLRLVMVDPKRVELTFYNDLPHLSVPVIVEPHQATAALRWAVVEMDRRYKLLSAASVRNMAAYNEKAAQLDARPLPYVVIVIDELADLMMTSGGEVEDLICRIAQLARAVGIHLVVATQRPSTDVITGLIKANMPSRIAFAVGSQVDSRVILDSPGAEKLLGRGDMLYQPIDAGKPTRIQGAFVGPTELERVIAFWKDQSDPHYMEAVTEQVGEADDEEEGGGRRLDPLFARAARAICAEGTASVSLVQRKFNVGYSRAGRIVDQLAEHRVIGAYQGSKSREILMTSFDVDDLLERLGLE